MVDLDFAPLYRSTIGFDRVPQLLQTAARTEQSNHSHPPYNIEKTGPDDYRIVLALAGFTRDDLEIVTEQNRLTVRGEMAGSDDDAAYLHCGLARQSFERRFELADFVEVKSAALENGLLTVELKRELPEKMKPRKIEIGDAKSVDKTLKQAKKLAA